MNARNSVVAAAALLACFAVTSASAANNTPLEGKWKFSTEDQDQPDLSFADDKRTIFDVGCGARFVLWAVHPLASKKPPNDQVGMKVTLKIRNGKTMRRLTGLLQAGFGDTPPGDHYPTTSVYVVQTDLGYDHSSPEAYGDNWHKDEAALLDFLDSGGALTISAEGASYTLPRIDISDWKARFSKIC